LEEIEMRRMSAGRRRVMVVAPFLFVALGACGAPTRPTVATPTPPAAGMAAVLQQLTGPAQFEAGTTVRVARRGDHFSPADTLLLPSGSAAVVLLPDGASTVHLAPGARLDQAGRAVDTTFRVLVAQSPAAGIVVSGRASVTVAPGTELTALCGAAVLHTAGPADFSVTVGAGNYPDALVQVTTGQVTASSSEGGGPRTLTAGQQGTVRLPRGH
jgi:hypothetical protein